MVAVALTIFGVRPPAGGRCRGMADVCCLLTPGDRVFAWLAHARGGDVIFIGSRRVLYPLSTDRWIITRLEKISNNVNLGR